MPVAAPASGSPSWAPSLTTSWPSTAHKNSSNELKGYGSPGRVTATGRRGRLAGWRRRSHQGRAGRVERHDLVVSGRCAFGDLPRVEQSRGDAETCGRRRLPRAPRTLTRIRQSRANAHGIACPKEKARAVGPSPGLHAAPEVEAQVWKRGGSNVLSGRVARASERRGGRDVGARR